MKENNISERIKNFPVSFFSVVMGISGFAIASQKMHDAGFISGILAESALYLALALFIIFVFLYSSKIIFFRGDFYKEIQNPVKLSFLPSFSISLLLLSVGFLAYNKNISFCFWIAGSFIHFFMTLFVMSEWITQKRFEIHHFSPAWFIPVVGNILVPVSGVSLGQLQVSWFFFSIGIVFWIIFFTVFIYRIIFHHPMPEKLIPTFFILIAPPAVGYISYVKLTGAGDSFSNVLFFTAVFLALLLIFNFRMFLKIKYYLSWWAYSFPVSALVIAVFLRAKQTSVPLYEKAAFGIWIFLSSILLIIGVLTIKNIFDKKICVEE